jgi:uncharacterized protein YgbK (DUF1537 family)
MRIGLLADDLTGAMDTAVRFVPLTGAIPVRWIAPPATGARESFAFDLATRELDAAQAMQRAISAAPLLAGTDIAYLKCDSLLRGWAAEEIAGCLRPGGFDHCVIAPAFPAQRRVTRQGRQWAAPLSGETWVMVGPALQDQLGALGLTVARRQPHEVAPAGLSLWDAETDADLHRIVTAARALPGRVLWCGTAGLAEALAGVPPSRIPVIRTPLLALVGSNHPVTASQLAQAAAWHCVLDPHSTAAHAAVSARLLAQRAVVLSIAVPEGVDRDIGAAQIAQGFARVVGQLPRPATLFATGGETLRGICEALGASVLRVEGEIAAGVPVSRMQDGRWAGTEVVSKSGAFGDAGLLGRLISSAL